MLLGRFEEAWRASDRIAQLGLPDRHRLWDGRPFAGQRVIIRCLHGYGDAIQFLRYARLLRRDAARVIVETHPEMVSVLRGMPFLDEVITWAADPYTDWDRQIEVMELPRAFRTTLATIPAEVPYLSVWPQCLERSRSALGPAETPRIGVLWAASGWNPARSMPLGELLPVLRLPSLAFYSFQRDAPRLELAALDPPLAIHDTALHSHDIADTAADLMHMDLLICVDTMAAHLAGALGKPVWVILPYAADWRWMLDREDSPWYPTMRLFRQPQPGDWRTPIERIAGLLRAR